jgi:hypothetical protein
VFAAVPAATNASSGAASVLDHPIASFLRANDTLETAARDHVAGGD